MAIVTRAYRKVIDAARGSKSPRRLLEPVIKEQKKELDNLVNRGYTTGFLLGKEPKHNFSGETFGNKFQFVGEIVGVKDKLNIVQVHNEIYLKDKIEAITPEKNIPIKIKKIYDDKMQEMEEAHGGHERKYLFVFNEILPAGSLIRKKLK